MHAVQLKLFINRMAMSNMFCWQTCFKKKTYTTPQSCFHVISILERILVNLFQQRHSSGKTQFLQTATVEAKPWKKIASPQTCNLQTEETVSCLSWQEERNRKQMKWWNVQGWDQHRAAMGINNSCNISILLFYCPILSLDQSHCRNKDRKTGEEGKDSQSNKERKKDWKKRERERKKYGVAAMTLGTIEQCSIICLTFFIVCNWHSFSKRSALWQQWWGNVRPQQEQRWAASVCLNDENTHSHPFVSREGGALMTTPWSFLEDFLSTLVQFLLLLNVLYK